MYIVDKKIKYVGKNKNNTIITGRLFIMDHKGPESFNCKLDSFTLGVQWEKWRRSFEIYLDVTQVSCNKRKLSLLLHYGGQDLQEIYYNIPDIKNKGEIAGDNVDLTGDLAGDETAGDNTDKTVVDVDGYNKALQKLDKYFAPKKNRFFERRVFRKICQGIDEKFDQFVMRLRTQAAKCEFKNESLEESLIDQIVEGCSSSLLRKKILSEEKTLDEIVMIGCTLESVAIQSQSFQSSLNQSHQSEILRVNDNKNMKSSSSKLWKLKCFKCNSNKHLANDISCPAKNQQCNSCKRKGHFAVVCRMQNKHFDSRRTDGTTKRIRTIENDDEDKENVKRVKDSEEYIFHLGIDGKLQFEIGGVLLGMVVDSGARANVIGEKDWIFLKNGKVNIMNQFVGSDKTLKAYGSNEPLPVKGTFDAIIKAGNKEIKARFYVVTGGETSLLGKFTATDLGVLKIGIPLNEVSETKDENLFPKIKGTIFSC